MMRFIDNLYVDDALGEKKAAALDKLLNGRFDHSVQVITLAFNPSEQLEFYPSYYLVEPGFDRFDPIVVGIASSKKRATEMIVDIITEVVSKTGNIDGLRTYLLKKNAASDSPDLSPETHPDSSAENQ